MLLTDRSLSHHAKREAERTALATIEEIVERGATDIEQGRFRTIATAEDRRALLDDLNRRALERAAMRRR